MSDEPTQEEPTFYFPFVCDKCGKGCKQLFRNTNVWHGSLCEECSKPLLSKREETKGDFFKPFIEG